MRKAVLILTSGLVAACPGVALCLPDSAVAPLPFVRLASPAPAFAAPSPGMSSAMPRTSRLPSIALLKSGLDALSGRDIPQALGARNQLGEDSLDRRILTWAIATSGQPGVPFLEIANAQKELKGWPGLSSLRSFSERAMARENLPVAQVLAVFGKTMPETAEGAILLSRALIASGKSADVALCLRKFWRERVLDKATEDRILSEFSSLLTPADHKARMDFLLYRGRTAQAERFSVMGKAQSLYKAWSAVLQKSPKAEALLSAVDLSRRSDPASLFARIENLRRQDKFIEAAILLEQAPRDAAALIDTAEWWNERRIVARGLADLGKFKQAYQVAANHSATSATDIVDAEFHAGWYALRGLKDPASAEQHFRKILQTSTRPISASRAWYWLGRAAEAGGPGKAEEFYAKAAVHSGTFYGQLAASKIGVTALNVTYPTPSIEEKRNFEARDAVRAISRLDEAGHGNRAASLYRALAEQLDSPGELAILASRAEKIGNHQLALQIGKTAFSRGIDAAALAYPIGVIPASADIAGSGKALAYAIARQESAFNPAAVSPADARGLLQLMPATAKNIAGRLGLNYVAARLTSDPGYNATLGAYYLGEQIDAFGGSYVLTFVAYNAGPKRVPEWIARYGDPRGKSIEDVVDWIERIPFPETRNYVQRVMENYQVYKVRLGQKADIENDTRYGR